MYYRERGSRFQGGGPVPLSVDQGLKIEVRTLMPWKIASGSIWDRFWLPKWVPNRGSEAFQTRFLTYISFRSKKIRHLHALFIHYQHGDDAI